MTRNPFLDPDKEIVQGKTDEDILAEHERMHQKKKPQVCGSPTHDLEDLLRGEAFYDAKLPEALRQALAYAGDAGFVLTMPELLQARIAAAKGHEYWQRGYDVLSDEYVGPGPDGSPVVIVLHGGGLLTPGRIERAIAEGLTGTHAARLDEGEWPGLLEGRLPDGITVPMYSYDDVASSARELPWRYGVLIPFEDARSTQSGRQDREQFLANPLAIARSGGEETAAAYFDRAQKEGTLGCWHLFGSVDPGEAQGRVLFADVGNYGLYGNSYLDNLGRFLGVRGDAPKARRARGGKR